MSIAIRRIRFFLDINDHTPALDLITAAQPVVWRGAELRVEVATGYDGDVYDVKNSEVPVVYLELHASDRSGNLWPAAKAPNLGGYYLEPAETELTQELWDAGLEDDASFIWQLSKEDMQVVMESTSQADLKTTFWLVVHVVTTTGTYITLGGLNLIIEEDGVQNDISGNTPTATVKVVDGDLYLYDFGLSKWLKYNSLNGALVAAQE